MDRRNFLKTTAAVGSGVWLGSISAAESGIPFSGKSRIVLVQKSNVIQKNWQVTLADVQQLLDAGMKKWFGTESVTAAWRALVQPSDVVGVKVNCLAGKGLSTRPELVDAIIGGLRLAGVQAKNIYVWDRLNDDLRRAGFKIQTSGDAVKFLGNDSAGYQSDLTCFGQVGSLVSRVVTDFCNVLINVPVLKDHGIVGVSVALKNYFGAIHNPNKYHDHRGDPYVADVNMFPDIRHKTCFTICDALVAQYEGGPPFMPQWAWPFGGLLLGNDMVAMDQIGWQIIEEKRQLEGIKNLKQAGREPTYIATAAGYGLGTNRSAQIELIKMGVG
jgi:uncharacterized protein (DUF362 family)